MIVATYFEPLDGYTNGNHEEVIELWRESWSNQGCQTILLGPGDCKNPFLIREFQIAQDRFPPSVNPAGYDFVCLKRWVAAMDWAKKDKIVFMDYDVFPTDRWEGWPSQCFCAEFDHIPTCVMGRGSDFRRIIDTLAKYVPERGEKIVLDMTILRSRPDVFDTHYPWTLCYGQPGWERKPLVHFGNYYMPFDKPRADVIRQLMDPDTKRIVTI